MTGTPTLRQALATIDGVRFVTPSEREEQVVTVSFEAHSVEADTVEGSEFRITEVPALDQSKFTHFLDGAQRSWQILYHRLSPVYVAHTSAAVLERVDGDLLPPSENDYRGDLEAFVPDNPALADALRVHMKVVSVKVRDTHPGGLDEVVRQAISDRRDDLEKDLAQRFSAGKLLIDGGLGNALRHQGEQPFVIGLVKSHRKQYFRSAKRTDMILGMRTGQRSSVFVRPADSQQGESVYSFYLRLREGDAVGPLFGLVRIEMPAEPDFVARADEIAGWLLHERAPLSLPDPRFDKLLYPIRLVEQHLKARQPGTAAIMGLIG
ncbi:MAG TPA: hypothetical protein VHE55_04720 [Fimbriimonadaceae bacterium]|nr:hypothetical protein [Fimbriimonadaceae bacterium]